MRENRWSKCDIYIMRLVSVVEVYTQLIADATTQNAAESKHNMQLIATRLAVHTARNQTNFLCNSLIARENTTLRAATAEEEQEEIYSHSMIL